MTFDTELGLRALAVRQGLNEIAAASAARLHPEYGVCFWKEGTASAAFAGDSSLLTQSCGIEFEPNQTAARLERIVDFYSGRSQKWELILTPFEGSAASNLAIERGFRLSGFESVMFRDLTKPLPAEALPNGLSIEELDPNRYAEWSDAAMMAFFGPEKPDFADEMMAILNGSPADCFMGLADGRIVSVASSVIFEDTVFLGGMGTLESHRNKGFQSAMIARRLTDAAEKGARWAMIETAPGSGSQRNAMRAGFEIVYTASIWLYEDVTPRSESTLPPAE